MKRQRKHYTPEEKVAILRRHLLEQVPISELCDNHGLQLFRFSWKWRKRSPIKIMERTHEEATEALLAG